MNKATARKAAAAIALFAALLLAAACSSSPATTTSSTAGSSDTGSSDTGSDAVVSETSLEVGTESIAAMIEGRQFHSITTLSDGRLLVVAGKGIQAH